MMTSIIYDEPPHIMSELQPHTGLFQVPHGVRKPFSARFHSFISILLACIAPSSLPPPAPRASLSAPSA